MVLSLALALSINNQQLLQWGRHVMEGFWVTTSGQNRWKGSPNDSLFIEFLDQYKTCLLSYK